MTLSGGPADDAFLISDTDLWLLAEGTHQRPYEVLGAHPLRIAGVAGTRFAVWAPHARRVAVVGEFNDWDRRAHPLRERRGTSVWEGFVPGVGPGLRYQYALEDAHGAPLPPKADPYALASEPQPGLASRIAELPPRLAPDAARRAANAPDAPIAIYEVHLTSWRRPDEGGWLDWAALTDTLIPYALDLGFTHVQLLPLGEHPLDDTGTLAPLALYAPGARLGEPAGLAQFVARAHAQGLGVLLDWSPGRFAAQPHGLARFDGTPLYERVADEGPRQRDSLAFELARPEVRAFLLGNALYWLERYGLDGLHLRDVSALLYDDDGRPRPGALALLRRLVDTVATLRPGACLIADAASALPPELALTALGGLNFQYQWDSGWAHDTLRHFSREPAQRRQHHAELGLGLVPTEGQRCVLPLSHDLVEHGQGTLIARMPGERAQQFANLRALYASMWARPGKKLLFMGGELAQHRPWNPHQALDWQLLGDELHAGVQQLVRDLNRVLRQYPALHARDSDPAGLEWIVADDAEHSVHAFVRHGLDEQHCLLVVSNLAPVLRRDWRLGVPRPGRYHERLNTDSVYYGGGNAGTPWGVAGTEPIPAHGRTHSVLLTLPPLATVYLEWIA